MVKPLDKPERPVLPNITAEEAQHVPVATWRKFVIRHVILRQYAEELETIIDSTKTAK